MLTPEDFEELNPTFEEIRRLLSAARIAGQRYGKLEEAYGYYIVALGHMENLVDEVEKKQGHKVMDVLKRVGNVANSPEGAGTIGAAAAGTPVPILTGLGGFGIAAGGTAFGVAGLAGMAVATGGTALAGAAAAYLLYKGRAATLETELGQKTKDRVRQSLGKVRDRFSKSTENDLPE